MAPLRLTPSRDGVHRATVRVEFRVDTYRLTLAAMWELERQVGELATVKVCSRIISRFSRAGLLAAARSMYQQNGYNDSGVGEGMAAGNEDLCTQRVKVLFPEFD